MPEFQAPTFGEEPRKEAPGEKRQRYAGTITQVANYLNVKLAAGEIDKIARFVVNVVGQLTPEQQKALAELAGKVAGWAANKYMGK